jgi:hypothetical protein
VTFVGVIDALTVWVKTRDGDKAENSAAKRIKVKTVVQQWARDQCQIIKVKRWLKEKGRCEAPL